MAKTKNSFQKILSLVFLAGYLLNIVSFESFHHAIHHHHHSELHSAEAEADACHRAIYHGDISQDCNHANHLSETPTNCELCKVLNSRSSELLVTEPTSTRILCSSVDEPLFGSDFILEPILLQSFLRGPPNA